MFLEQFPARMPCKPAKFQPSKEDGIAYTCAGVVIRNVVSAIGPWSHQRNAAAPDASSGVPDCIVEKNVTGGH